LSRFFERMHRFNIYGSIGRGVGASLLALLCRCSLFCHRCVPIAFGPSRFDGLLMCAQGEMQAKHEMDVSGCRLGKHYK
jgi:hypothetical protein